MESPSDQKPKLAFAAAAGLLIAGAILRLSAPWLSVPYGSKQEAVEHAIIHIALVLMASGAAVAAVTVHHWLRRA